MAGKVYLRNNHERVCALNPYTLTTDSTEPVNTSMFGEVYVVPLAMGDDFVLGIGEKLKIALPLKTVAFSEHMTPEVYDLIRKFGGQVASAHSLEGFVDETTEPTEIKFQRL
jgi:hypothetical protein